MQAAWSGEGEVEAASRKVSVAAPGEGVVLVVALGEGVAAAVVARGGRAAGMGEGVAAVVVARVRREAGMGVAVVGAELVVEGAGLSAGFSRLVRGVDRGRARSWDGCGGSGK